LGCRSPEALLPIALLHHRVSRAHAEAGLPALATAASEQAEALGESYARAGGNRAVAAALMTGLAGYQHARFQETIATALYRRALELDPRQPAALLGLAVVFEKRGSLREAGSLLDAVAALAPEDRESRLRRALVHARSGRLDQAVAAFDELVPQGGDDWIAALAYQEHARLLASTGRLADALATAREGQAKLPCDSALPLLAAFYAEQAGVAADGLARVLAACAGEARESPRRMYNQHPRRLLEQTWLRLEQAERERLPVLAAALGARAGG
jgi:tetratricopeptide (TPR) repeat protein